MRIYTLNVFSLVMIISITKVYKLIEILFYDDLLCQM